MKTLAIITALLFAINCYSQITTITKKEIDKSNEIQKYDSLTSLNYENAPLHVGQMVFLKGCSYSKKNGFYHYFFTEIITDSIQQASIEKGIYLDPDNYTYKPIKKNINDRTDIVSDHSALAGKYYKIESVTSEKTRHQNEVIYWIKLIDADNIPFYCKIEKTRNNCKDFVTVGYYEKMKRTFVGKDFYSKGRYEIDKVDTDEKVVLPFKVKFKCTDIAVNVGENDHIFAVLENEKYGKMKGVILEGRNLNHFISISYYNQCIKNYGAKFGSWVAEGKIEIGMNKNMVRDAWGSPKEINVTEGNYGRHEQWVYHGDRYLYFQNGRLTSIQS